MDKMYGGNMNAHKAMAGAGSSGSFGVDKLPSSTDKVKNPHGSIGENGAMADSERGIGAPVARGKGQYPAQAHPDHGPHHDTFNRGGKA
jgi:hypothetical protein